MLDFDLACRVVLKFSFEYGKGRDKSGVLMSDEEIRFVELNIDWWREIFEIVYFTLEE